jgi:hypothetical protein
LKNNQRILDDESGLGFYSLMNLFQEEGKLSIEAQ